MAHLPGDVDGRRLPNYFTINGKAYPETDSVRMRVGQSIKLRFIGTNNNFIHPMHVHGGPFEVVARDGETRRIASSKMLPKILRQ